MGGHHDYGISVVAATRIRKARRRQLRITFDEMAFRASWNHSRPPPE